MEVRVGQRCGSLSSNAYFLVRRSPPRIVMVYVQLNQHRMREIIEQMTKASEAKLYYVALFTALALPDICGAAESSDGVSTPERYKAWFDANVSPKYNACGVITLRGVDAYQFRCSMLHQARMNHPNSAYTRILFVEPNKQITLHNNVLNDALNIDIQIFVNDVATSAEQWLTSVARDPAVERNLEMIVRRYDNGIPPYIVGLPVIG